MARSLISSCAEDGQGDAGWEESEGGVDGD